MTVSTKDMLANIFFLETPLRSSVMHLEWESIKHLLSGSDKLNH